MEMVKACDACIGAPALADALKMAFQPIVDARARVVLGHEALVRGADGRRAGEVISAIKPGEQYAFDQACRIVAIQTAARTQPAGLLSINFLPNAVYDPEHCLRKTFDAAQESGWPLNRVIFEVTEHEEVVDHGHLVSILTAYKAHGFLTAIDDFGAGYAGLNLLADFQPDLVKLDIGLVRGVAHSRPRQSIVRHMVSICHELAIRPLGEGVETVDDAQALLDLGVELQQGYLYARPALEHAPTVTWPHLT
jgi:EAL domain-containing protein (putative c-di-GMP-specific phosphodiesterase class I)